ncbi:sigma-70 family RNA polymerase sigma factor [Echinimonas agarilytica]|uniref:RNA polymerase sigma factor n=1 Tax=Echinimonas agarilytica TaxID=1215918 RepID=A0AA41W3U6_9GAMM|nr:sigma-70 family RNA polymerase sigma factor [Echinimonas agarilytica]MCM2678316.1 sigma-70 family RNA polymerase sigma factor [Echinimonas agarilytica]
MTTATMSVSGYTPSNDSNVSKAMSSNPMTQRSRDEGKQWKLTLVEIGETQSKAAYTKLFNHFAPRLKAFAMKLCGTEALALELVQDTMLSVWQKAHLYNPDKGAASTWIFTIARNLRYDAMRKLSNKADTISAEDLWPILEADAGDGRNQPDHLVLQLQLEKYYDALSEVQMEVIRKVYLEDKPQQQVAEELNIPLGTVKSRIRLAVQKLQEKIEANHD